MATSPFRSFAGLFGAGRQARWRRLVLRRLLAACCAAAAVVLVVTRLQPAPPSTVDVVVAARAVPAGAVLAPADLELRPRPADGLEPRVLREVAAGLDRRLMAPLAAGESLTASRLAPRSAAEGLGAGQVPVHLLLADTAGADLLWPGQPVAVYALGGGDALSTDATVLSVDPVREPAFGGLADPAAGRGVVVSLPADDAPGVLVGDALTGQQAPLVVVGRDPPS